MENLRGCPHQPSQNQPLSFGLLPLKGAILRHMLIIVPIMHGGGGLGVSFGQGLQHLKPHAQLLASRDLKVLTEGVHRYRCLRSHSP